MKPSAGAGTLVIESIEDEGHDWCVDIFRRADGSYGFEHFRRDPEDQGRWTAVGGYAGLRLDSEAAARQAAAHAIPWLARPHAAIDHAEPAPALGRS